MKPLDRITVCNEDRQHELGCGKLSVGTKWARIHVPGDPNAVLPDQSIAGMDIVASRNGEIVYAGDIWDVDDSQTPVGQKVKISALPSEEYDGHGQTFP